MMVRIEPTLVATVLRNLRPYLDGEVVELNVTLREGASGPQAMAIAMQSGAIAVVDKNL